METGFVIEVQHPNNIVSVYKHNASLLKETGDLVRAGEAFLLLVIQVNFILQAHICILRYGIKEVRLILKNIFYSNNRIARI